MYSAICWAAVKSRKLWRKKKKDAKTDTPDWWHGKKIHRQECCVFCNIREGKKETTRCVGVVGSDTSERVSGAVILSA